MAKKPGLRGLSMNQQYYEAILQLRSPSEKVTDFVVSAINRASRKTLVSRVVTLKTGVDLFISSRAFAVSLGRRLFGCFGGSLEISKRLYGLSKDNKRVYRVSVLFKPPCFRQGDVILYEGHIVLVSSLGRQAKGTDLDTGRRAVIDYKKDAERLEVRKSVVTKLHPWLEAMHPETFETRPVYNKEYASGLGLRQGSRVRVVISQGRVYAVDC
ncbi:TPA: hypothetical protein HA317_04380 [Candidatus Woesearchaeota archaeon]|nr:hypothetical protein [Candidatus Woesearchaeota archaeon]